MTLAITVYKLSHYACLPLTLLMNFSLFQYLVVTYWERRRERRVRLLLGSGLASFACLVMFSFPDDEFVRNMNDMSEVATVLTFLVQIAIIGHDVAQKMRLRSLQYATRVAELLILLGFVTVGANIVDNVYPHEDHRAIIALDHTVENFGMLFVFVFRFYVLSTFKGWRNVVRRHKMEVLWYALLVAHPLPFLALEHAYPEVIWDYVRGFVMRVLVVLALGVTVRDKIRNSSKAYPGTSQASGAPRDRNSVHGTAKVTTSPKTDRTRLATSTVTTAQVLLRGPSATGLLAGKSKGAH